MASADRARVWRDPWWLASALVVAVLLALIARFGADAGVTWDEVAQSQYGEMVLAWFRSGFTDRRAVDIQTLTLYGGLFDGVAQWIVHRVPFGPYETRHMVTALIALLGIVGTGLIATRLDGARAGFFGIVMLALTPAWIGHGLFNPKDLPFGAAVVFAVYASVRLATGPAPILWSDAFWAGLTVGIALAIRAGGVFLLGYPLFAAIFRGALELLQRRRTGEAMQITLLGRATVLRLTVVTLVAWVVMLSAWPWAQLSPIRRPLVAMAASRHFDWDGTVLFAGASIDAHAMPASYLPVWFGITLPDFYFVAFACSLLMLAWSVSEWRTWTPRRSAGMVVLLASLVLPLAGAIVTRPALYDGQRHFLFVFPLVAALSGVGVSEFLGSRRIPSTLRFGVAGIFVVASALVVIDIVTLHPYEYVYFNRVSGGLSRAAGRFETDYWGASYKEGFAWVVNELPSLGTGGPVRVSSCDPNSNQRLDYYRRRWPGAADRFVIAPEYKDADVYLAVTRFDCNKVRGKILHIVERQGVPLLFVIRTETGSS